MYDKTSKDDTIAYLMIRFGENIGIVGIPQLDGHGNPTTLSEATLRRRAEQKSAFMDSVQRDFYVGKLGVTRFPGRDPYPADDPEDVPWRMGLILAAGHVQRTGLQYFGAFELTKSGQISQRTTAMLGIIVLGKPRDEQTKKPLLCTPGNHTATEILEWDVQPRLEGKTNNQDRYQGLGGALLRAAMPFIHPADEVIADVMEPNTDAFTSYERYGFTLDTTIPPIEPDEDSIFDARQIRVHIPGTVLQERLARTPRLWQG